MNELTTQELHSQTDKMPVIDPYYLPKILGKRQPLYLSPRFGCGCLPSLVNDVSTRCCDTKTLFLISSENFISERCPCLRLVNGGQLLWEKRRNLIQDVCALQILITTCQAPVSTVVQSKEKTGNFKNFKLH